MRFRPWICSGRQWNLNINGVCVWGEIDGNQPNTCNGKHFRNHRRFDYGRRSGTYTKQGDNRRKSICGCPELVCFMHGASDWWGGVG